MLMDFHCLILKDHNHYKTKPKLNSKELKYTQTGIKYLKTYICETVKTQKDYGNKVSQSIYLHLFWLPFVSFLSNRKDGQDSTKFFSLLLIQIPQSIFAFHYQIDSYHSSCPADHTLHTVSWNKKRFFLKSNRRTFLCTSSTRSPL